jgi:cytochrome c-type biogenesis protein CcmH
MSMRRLLAAFLLVVAVAMPALAVEPDEILSDPALEARARALSAGFRCLVCQNQSVDDSDAPLARDLRLLIRERLKAGNSDAEVKAYVVSRYGDFVLLRPPFDARTLLLWLSPFILLLAGLFFLATRRRAALPHEPLTEDESRRVRDLLSRE